MALSMFRKKVTGKMSSIDAAPPRVLLKAFGGYMTIEEFRESTKESAWVVPPPKLITHAQVVHDRKVGELTRRSLEKPVDLTMQIDLRAMQSNSHIPAVESLRLKRPKPVKKSSNMLEIALGLVSKESVRDS